MPFIPHTVQEVQDMLATIGIKQVAELFDEIPTHLITDDFEHIPPGVNEMTITREMEQTAQQDAVKLNFIGAGAYEHYIPAAVWNIVSRGEYLTAYTPYQAEASQGTLQLLYEYQSMMAALMGLDVSNASLYDGASALAESVLMAIRCKKRAKTRTVLVPKTLHPHYRQVLETLLAPQDIKIDYLSVDDVNGTILSKDLEKYSAESFVALIIPQPNFLGCLEEVDKLTNWAHQQQALVIGCVNPVAMALLKPPGQWGEKGADIACGEGQPLGVPLSSGGPYFGFLCCKQDLVRQMPGRLVGATLDSNGKKGYTLTLQAREQHIRRSKATSNICTNQGLLVTAATIYMALLGGTGLKQVAQVCHQRTVQLKKKLQQISGLSVPVQGASFHEFPLQFSKDSSAVCEQLAQQGIALGYPLQDDYPHLKNSILICCTETKTDTDLDALYQALSQ